MPVYILLALLIIEYIIAENECVLSLVQFVARKLDVPKCVMLLWLRLGAGLPLGQWASAAVRKHYAFVRKVFCSLCKSICTQHTVVILATLHFSQPLSNEFSEELRQFFPDSFAVIGERRNSGMMVGSSVGGVNGLSGCIVSLFSLVGTRVDSKTWE